MSPYLHDLLDILFLVQFMSSGSKNPFAAVHFGMLDFLHVFKMEAQVSNHVFTDSIYELMEHKDVDLQKTVLNNAYFQYRRIISHSTDLSDKSKQLDSFIRLWSMRYFQNGVYYFVEESKVKVSEDFVDKDKTLNELCIFFYTVKISLENIFEVLKVLKEEHKTKLEEDNSSSSCTLSDILCPKLFSLSYNKHGRGFGAEKLKSSPENE